MQIPILVEPVASNGYRATCGPPLAVAAEGATRAEAIDRLEQLLQDRLSHGLELVAAEVPARVVDNPWVKYAGMFKDDPMFAEVLEIMKENRRKDDEDAGYL
jgi:predicted RNase H-like HicB family nuclease